MINFSIIYSHSYYLLKGIKVTLEIAFSGCVIGFLLGTILAVIWYYAKNALLRIIIISYVGIMRGVPMLIQITFVFFLLHTIGLSLSAFWSAVFAIGFNSAAYVCNIIYSGLSSINPGQKEAAKSLGLSTFQTIIYITLPQAIKVVIPALGNEVVTLIKDSSLASIIGVTELTKESEIIISTTYDVITVYLSVALIYLMLTGLVSTLIFKIGKRMNKNA
jgi:His/Glu/Gln/Arg/opine family amino acid ABC transporter permease subunit